MKPHPATILAAPSARQLTTAPGFFPGYFDFLFGSCNGSLYITPSTLELVAVINSKRNNGTFAELLTHLKALAAEHKRDLLVLEIHNPRLGPHLAQRHGFTLVPNTAHAFLAVAGPGVVPAPYTIRRPPSALDGFLDLLLSHFD